ncbi:selenocysteine-specific translation elongation factor [Chitinasiproducens palmae]|uniref:Selenocysteine-specific elongation factor n=1 Tax=Chitinasiproducens palmae TaxID=1770053 RepID=A0A1H2PSS1_9BURK|nr:selenocysteine-specific translation elongation factor [Chitinasiproducens palmae]SDV50090.1 selenocysteine-specific translation elongation factor SelB [Chitinasiproducens palmae]
MIVGTAGHIDHGKTTLVRALTGVDTDRLKEEKARGISIELGYAYTPLPDGQVLGIIDVPGHERLIHTMTAGASGIDYALLVVAADDGPMPQTLEHLAILQMLGVDRAVVALTKADRVDAARLAAVESSIAALLPTYRMQAAAIIATNATAPDDPGVAALRAHLADAAQATGRRRDDALCRLAVDRVFTLAGLGTVATGTLIAGRVAVGDTLLIVPGTAGPREARVRGLHVQNRPAELGHAGERCAVNLAGADKRWLARGDALVDPRLSTTSPRLDVELALLQDADTTLVHWTPVHVHLGTMHAVAQVVLLDAETLGPGSRGRVQLVFGQEVLAVPGDRFVMRNAQANRTIGGGRVLDPFGVARKRRTPERHAWLDALHALIEGGGIDALLARAPLGLSAARLAHLSGVAPDRLSLPPDAVRLPLRGSEQAHLFAADAWRALRDGVLAALDDCHRRTPDEPGVELSRLRRIAYPTLDAAVWRAVVDALIGQDVVARSGPWLHLPDHRVSFNADEEASAADLLRRLTAGDVNPPWVRDLARETRGGEEATRQLLRKMAQRGEVFQIVRDLFYARAVIERLAALIAKLAGGPGGERIDATAVAWSADANGVTEKLYGPAGQANGMAARRAVSAGDDNRRHDGRNAAAAPQPGAGGVSAAAFRDATGLGRKRAIQVLEFFDRLGYTRFHRERHLLRSDSQWQARGSD